MLTRRTVLGAPVAMAAAASAGPAFAIEAAFTSAAFTAAQKAGKPILIDVAAPWCPICKAQQPLLKSLLAEPRFGGVQRFDIDFDSQKTALRQVGARMQSTLIVYKGSQEVGRSIGQTQKEWIEDLLEKLL